jgi:hypothetical protein
VTGIILPVLYFPPISYYACLVSGRHILLETGETFPKQTLRNRCEIASSSGRQALVVPVQRPGGNRTKTHEVLISRHENWQLKHRRALETAYSSSPFFLYYSDSILEFLSRPHHTLLDLNTGCILKTCELIGFTPDFTLSEEYRKEAGDRLDLRMAFSKKGFAWQSNFKPYPQVFSQRSGFLSNLSILDLLFNIGPESYDYLKETAKVILPPGE